MFDLHISESKVYLRKYSSILWNIVSLVSLWENHTQICVYVYVSVNFYVCILQVNIQTTVSTPEGLSHSRFQLVSEGSGSSDLYQRLVTPVLDLIGLLQYIPSQIIPPSPSPTESKRLFFTSMSLLLSHIQGHRYHLSKFHIYVLVYCIGVFLSD